MRIPPHYFILPILTQWVVRIATLTLWHIRASIVVRGTENLENLQSPVIFAANHLSEWDGPVIRSVLPMFSKFTPMFYVSLPKKFYQTKERGFVRRFLWGGRFFKIVGAYPVYKGTHNLKQALRHHLKILEDGGNVTIFPEGKKSLDGSVDSFHKGVAYLAHRTGVPVVPVAICGTSRNGPCSRHTKGVALRVCFGKPVFAPKKDGRDATLAELSEFSARLRTEILKLGESLEALKK